MRRSVYPLGTRVQIDAGLASARTGRVVGHCTAHRMGGQVPVPLLAVELDSGYYDEARTTYVSITLAHPDALSPEAN